MAEYYHIYDWEAFRVGYIATLAKGLPDNSRSKRSLSKSKLTIEQSLMAKSLDALNLLCWTKTKDAEHGWNKPESVYKALNAENRTKNNKGFESGADFDKAFAQIVGDNNG